MHIKLIAALDRNGVIGSDNTLPWHLPDDLKRFKSLTLGKTILMGRKTAESLGRTLPKRENLVLTRSGVAPFSNMRAVASLEEALEVAGKKSRELWVIGGGEIYAATLPLATHLHLTHVDTEVNNGDAFFPPLLMDHWRVTRRVQHSIDDTHPLAFEFVDYERSAGH